MRSAQGGGGRGLQEARRLSRFSSIVHLVSQESGGAGTSEQPATVGLALQAEGKERE